jgi:hypothetical protein
MIWCRIVWATDSIIKYIPPPPKRAHMHTHTHNIYIQYTILYNIPYFIIAPWTEF